MPESCSSWGELNAPAAQDDLPGGHLRRRALAVDYLDTGRAVPSMSTFVTERARQHGQVAAGP